MAEPPGSLREEAARRRQAEEKVRSLDRQLREIQTQQKAILDGIPDIAWLKDRESRFIAVNRPFGLACGVLPDDLAGKTDLDIWPSGLAERYRQDDREVMESGMMKRVEEPLCDPQGRQTWIETVKVPVIDGHGRVIGTVGIARDITERKMMEDALRRSRDELEGKVAERTAALETANANLRSEIADRARIEEALRESEDRYRDLVEHSQVLICTHDLKGRLRSMNPFPAKILGYSREEMLGRNLSDFIAPEFRDRFDVYLEEIGKNGAARGILLTLTRSGERRIWEYNNTLRTEGITEPIVRGMAHDVTERVRAEKALRDSEIRYRSIFDHGTDGIVIIDPATAALIDFNQQACGQLGYTREEFGRLKISDIDLLEDHEEVKAHTRKILDNGYDEFETLHRTKDGERRNVHVKAHYIRVGGKSLYHCIWRDITERKRLEKERQESQELFRIITSHTPDHLLVQDRDLRYSFVMNPQLGLTEKEMIGKTDHDFLPIEDADKLTEAKRNVLDTGKPLRLDTSLPSRAGKREHFEGTYVPKYDARGQIDGLIGYFRNVTDRKRAEDARLCLERQVQQAQKMEGLGVLAGGIAHDFNNILMAVLGHAELALEEISPMSAARGNLTEITTAARRAADLCRQMLAYAGKATFALERVGLREMVEEMAHLLRTAISKKAILSVDLEHGLPPIQADPSQIRQIVMNLIINASEAIGDRSGVVTVSVGATRCDEEYLRETELREDLPPGLYVHLEVTDTGCGMDAETRSRIFEPFFSTKFTGRGLGLAAVQGIVRAHKGALKVYSEPGKGTTFKILFPALEFLGNKARTDKSSPLADWRGTGTILLVDDEENLIALGARMLEHLGFTVLTASDGLQAVELYRQRGKEIDLVLMDLTMPHMDGSEACGVLRRLNPDVKVVLSSGYSREDVTSRFAGKSLDGVLQKPYTLAMLREALAGLMPRAME